MWRAGLLLFLVTMLAAGCGGSSGGGGGGKRLSRSQFVAKADAICTRYNEKSKSLGKPTSFPELVKTFDKGLPLLENVIAELRTLKPPASEQHTVDQWLAQSEVFKHDLQEMRDKAKAKDLQGVQEAFSRAGADAKAGNSLAAKLGLKACTQS